MDSEELKQKILSKVLMFLAYRTRTRKEILQRLEKYLKAEKGLDDGERADLTRYVFDYLEQNKLINDEQFAKLFIESKSKGKKVLGKRMILAKLMEKGISKDDAEMYLETTVSEGDEVEAAVKVLANKYKTSAVYDPQKMGRFLLSRGFSYSIVKQAVDYLLKRP